LKFIPLASSSHGNAYLVEDSQTRILVDCGLAFRTLQKRLGFDLSSLAAVFVTHEHKDHARCAEELAKRGRTVYMSAGTALALGLAEEMPLSVMRLSWSSQAVGGGTDPLTPLRSVQDDNAGAGGQIARATDKGQLGPAFPVYSEAAVAVRGAANVELVEHLEQFRVGSFDVVAFTTYHDAAEPLGFLIRSRADGDVTVIATDTVNLRYRFPGLRILGIEANYDKAVLERCTRIPEKVHHRITNTHMEIDTLCGILAEMRQRGELDGCREIWLLHLSDATSHEGHFLNKVRRVVPPWVTVRAACRGQ
jgi:phosphoribosyl 1,2-cyclic phosphodiesterase